jgi:hypothetical protein
MNVLFLPREGVELYQELLSSETSRDALRFYRPAERHGGVMVTMASLGSALSLASDLRWYVRRYMRDVLFEISDGVYCTHDLAREIYYDRTVSPGKGWKFRRVYVIQADRLVSVEKVSPDKRGDLFGARPGEIRLEVWCTEEEDPAE